MRNNYSQMHISKMNHWTFLQNKTEKEKTNWNLWNWIVLILKLACNRRFVQEDWRPSKRTPPNEQNLYNLCKRKKNSYVKQPHWVPTLLLPLYLKASYHFATWLKVDQIGWRRPTLIVDTEVWSQDDPMRHSNTIQSLTFAWISLSGFQSIGIIFLFICP